MTSDLHDRHPFEAVAEDCADRADARRMRMERRIKALREEIEELRAEIAAGEGVRLRARAYPVRMHGELVCPHCWVEKDLTAPLREIPSSGPETRFYCRECGAELEA